MATTTIPSYQIRKAQQRPAMDCNWNAPVWSEADVAVVEQFQPDGSDHRPRTEAKLLHHEEGLCGIFRVEDQYVRATRTEFQSNVYLDACVELFIRPKADKGYMNFEMNCCGTLLHYYIEDWRPKGDRFEKFTVVPEEHGERIEVVGSFDKPVDPEIAEPVTWCLQYFIPFRHFEEYVGPLETGTGAVWYGNFNKLAVECSHPHFATWAPIGENNFHQPDKFAPMVFA